MPTFPVPPISKRRSVLTAVCPDAIENSTVFQQCFEQFQRSVANERPISRTSQRRNIGRDHQEYAADFILTAKRTLGADSDEYRVFRMYFLLSADGGVVARKLGLERLDLHLALVRIQDKLGQAFRTMRPYALWPVRDYFAGKIRKAS